jgi:hypothetical protein
MTTWPTSTLAAIAGTDDLHISPFRADGTTYGTPTWIWSVVVDDALYVRPYNGANSRWYASAMRQRAGRIRAAGAEHDVTFDPADESVNDAVDAAYQIKYRDSPYLPPMLTAKTRAATVKISPRL